MFHGIPRQLKFGQVALLAHDRELWKQMAKCIGKPDEEAQLSRIISKTPWAAKMLRQQWQSPHGITTRARWNTRNQQQQSINEITQQEPKASPSHGCKKHTKASVTKVWPIFQKHGRKTKPKRKRKQTGRQQLTNKQRAAEAHAHYVIHHGSAISAARLLRGDISNLANATIERLHKLATANKSTTTTAATQTCNQHNTPPPTPQFSANAKSFTPIWKRTQPPQSLNSVTTTTTSYDSTLTTPTTMTHSTTTTPPHLQFHNNNTTNSSTISQRRNTHHKTATPTTHQPPSICNATTPMTTAHTNKYNSGITNAIPNWQEAKELVFSSSSDESPSPSCSNSNNQRPSAISNNTAATTLSPTRKVLMYNGSSVASPATSNGNNISPTPTTPKTTTATITPIRKQQQYQLSTTTPSPQTQTTQPAPIIDGHYHPVLTNHLQFQAPLPPPLLPISPIAPANTNHNYNLFNNTTSHHSTVTNATTPLRAATWQTPTTSTSLTSTNHSIQHHTILTPPHIYGHHLHSQRPNNTHYPPYSHHTPKHINLSPIHSTPTFECKQYIHNQYLLNLKYIIQLSPVE